jgi:hypothetical protein
LILFLNPHGKEKGTGYFFQVFLFRKPDGSFPDKSETRRQVLSVRFDFGGMSGYNYDYAGDTMAKLIYPEEVFQLDRPMVLVPLEEYESLIKNGVASCINTFQQWYKDHAIACAAPSSPSRSVDVLEWVVKVQGRRVK